MSELLHSRKYIKTILMKLECRKYVWINPKMMDRIITSANTHNKVENPKNEFVRAFKKTDFIFNFNKISFIYFLFFSIGQKDSMISFFVRFLFDCQIPKNDRLLEDIFENRVFRLNPGLFRHIWIINNSIAYIFGISEIIPPYFRDYT